MTAEVVVAVVEVQVLAIAGGRVAGRAILWASHCIVDRVVVLAQGLLQHHSRQQGRQRLRRPEGSLWDCWQTELHLRLWAACHDRGSDLL